MVYRSKWKVGNKVRIVTPAIDPKDEELIRSFITHQRLKGGSEVYLEPNGAQTKLR